ncbi:TetR/AcrR family transcriptional regulator [Hyphomicrobium sp. CS1GBMeth3]|uniref:TetR/AcrR family transcriptional regulator n=1 Tax=Hyphomicrobium sp. CS1GBMeth3 TaxID=1892845 RepID=UPI000931A074|nr:TetR/AcrR family transcriptional regulator [Hyphomicrobium sp. CS1GBMeth3]
MPPDQKQKAKEIILEAGARTLREKGFHGVGVDGLAEAAGMTSGAFYSNFANKDALLEGVIEASVPR